MACAVLPREMIRWLQGLDLSCNLGSPKWDISNGYLVAEICSWYFPRDVSLVFFVNASSLDVKLSNWSLLKKVFRKNGLTVADEVIDATLHCKQAAAQLLIFSLYEQLTNDTVRRTSARQLSESGSTEFTDFDYQSSLPFHCRSTAIQAIRNNVPSTELKLQKDIHAVRRKTQGILEGHTEGRAKARDSCPQRYGRKATLGELAERRSPSPQRDSESGSRQSAEAGETNVNKKFEAYRRNSQEFMETSNISQRVWQKSGSGSLSGVAGGDGARERKISQVDILSVENEHRLSVGQMSAPHLITA